MGSVVYPTEGVPEGALEDIQERMHAITIVACLMACECFRATLEQAAELAKILA